MFRPIILAVLLVLAGCATPTPTSDPYVAFARDYFELLQKRDYAAARAKFDPEIESEPEYSKENLEAALALTGIVVPSEPPQSSKVLESRSARSAGVPAWFVVIEYQFPNGPRRYELTMRKIGESIVVRFLRVKFTIEIKGNETEDT